NLWDPEDEEWLDVNMVVATFKAGYKSPLQPSTGTPSYTETTFGDKVRSALLPSKQKAEQQQSLEEKRLQEDLDGLSNTYHYDPNGDLNDEVMTQVRAHHNCFFPVKTPDSWRSMHVIDLAAYFTASDPLVQQARPRLCDAIATALCHTDKNCLRAFLDPAVKEFAYRRELDNSKAGLILVIRRQGNEIICGAYRNLGFKMLWKLYVKSLFDVMGQWHEVYATSKPGEMSIKTGTPEWDNIQTDHEDIDPTLINDSLRKLELSQAKECVSPEDVNEKNPQFMLYQSRVLAKYLLWDMWYCYDNRYECRATWEADGEVSSVRLKRTLLGSREGED
ncbi:hypothetical protein GQ44DRAFT_583240, partial [Phaeosphaeriaceae sp. PMI808]